MTPKAAALVVAVALAVIAGLHLFWALRGGVRDSAVIPEANGRPLFVPTRLATVAVAILLLCASWLLLVAGGYASDLGFRYLGRLGAFAVGVVLIIRAIGEFRYVGFFKRVRSTRFAVLDTLWYSPLCLLLGLGALWSALAASR